MFETVKKITRNQLVRLMNSGKPFKLVDVLPEEHFRKEHIRGALSLPLAEIGKKASEFLKKDELIVVYCASFECQASTEAVKKLMAFGYTNVQDYKGGLADYKQADLPLEGSDVKAGSYTRTCTSCGSA